MSTNRTLAITHFGLLALLILNGVMLSAYSVGLNIFAAFALKLVFYFSGAILFFRYAKPFHKRALYYGIYVFYPVLAIIGYLMDGIFGAILFSFFFAMFWMPEPEKKSGDHIIIKPFNGFFNAGVRYQIKQNKYLLFQKERGEFRLDAENRLDKAGFHVEGDSAYINLHMKEGYPQREFDTTMVINLK